MSYEILYGRQFVSLDDGTYIPLILSGSSDRTMKRYGRVIQERHWWVIGQGNCLVKTEEELNQWICEQTIKNPNREWFLRSGKWLLANDMLQWMTSGIKSARTIEEIKQSLPSQFLRCSVVIYNKSKLKEDGYKTVENEQFIHNTEDLKKWVKEYKKRRLEKESFERVYPNIEFYGYEPLGLGIKTAKYNEPVICKIGNGYLYSFDASSNRYFYGSDITKAIVFESEEDFEEKTKGVAFVKYRLIKANQPQKNFAIKIARGQGEDVYVKQKTSRQMITTENIGEAKRFYSMVAAQNYIEKELEGKFDIPFNFVVFDVSK